MNSSRKRKLNGEVKDSEASEEYQLSTVETLFNLNQQRWPETDIPVDLTQEYRVTYINNITVRDEKGSLFQSAANQNVYELFNDTWDAINHVCGIIVDHYGISNDFVYHGKNKRYLDIEIRHLMVIVFPNVLRIKRLLSEIFDAVSRGQPVKNLTKALAPALFEFIPSLNLPVEPKRYPFFNASTLEGWLISPQNRPVVERGIMQLNKYCSKLEEAFNVMTRSQKCANT